LAADTPILAGSLRRALTLGRRRRPADAVLTALAERVGLGPALSRLGGLDGSVGEGGRALAQGERALVAVARLALAPEAVALVDGVDAHLDAGGRALLAAELAARPGAALVVARHADLLDALPARLSLTHEPDAAAAPVNRQPNSDPPRSSCVRDAPTAQ
jgi:ABC-type transport system involved in cytochrome bd biosynthesis fused ATPase/permease subunit